MQRYLVVIEYIGTNYQGSQKQPKKVLNNMKPVVTVQGKIEEAIKGYRAYIQKDQSKPDAYIQRPLPDLLLIFSLLNAPP